MSRCWNGHFFASNVGVLPSVGPCSADPRIVLSPRRPELKGKRVKRHRRARGLLACHVRGDTDDLRVGRADDDCDDDCGCE